MCEAFYGLKPHPGLQAAHDNGIRSDNRASNLSSKTPKANAADRHRHGTAMLGEDSPTAILTEQTVREMRAIAKLYGRGICAYLATRYGVNNGTAFDVITGKTWTHIEMDPDGPVPAISDFTPYAAREGDKRIGHLHTRGASNPRAKLNEDTVRHIRERVAAGEPRSVVGRKLGIPGSTISNVVRRATWSHVA